MPVEFSKFIDDVVGELIIGAEEMAFLKHLTYSAGRYPEFVKILKENPAVEANLIDAANRAYGTKLGETITSTEVALGMMGFAPARNYLVASIVSKGQYMTPWDESVKVLLRYALEAELHGGELASRYFAAGLVYDFLSFTLIKPDEEGNLPATPKFVADCWKHSLQVCAVARQIVNRMSTVVEIEKDICLHALLHDVGKVVYYMLDDTIKKDAPKLPFRSSPASALIQVDQVQDPAEIEREKARQAKVLLHFPDTAWKQYTDQYGLSHDSIGFFLLNSLGFLSESSWVVLYHHQPYLGYRRGDMVQKYASIVWLADEICRYRDMHKTARIGDKMLNGWYNVMVPWIDRISDVDFKSVINSLIVPK